MEKKRVRAVVLSGGGSKGSYQVGVWKALRRLHFNYKIVTGTSVGALNGILMVQKDYYKCLKLWENINFDQLFTETFPSNIDGIIGKTKVYHKYASNFIKHGGMNISRFEALVYKLYRPLRFFSSPIDYGIVTYNVTSHKTMEITKKEMTYENAPLYIMASASCYPAFPMKKIDGENYIDGGYSDNLPIHLAIRLGATEIVAVDLNAVGRKRKVKTDDVKITVIKPRNQIVSFLVFQKELSRKAIRYGYNDTMKAFGKLEGNIYTFYPKQLQKEYRKNGQRLKLELELRLDLKDSNLVWEQLLKISLFHHLNNDPSGKKKEKFFYEMVELLGKSLKVDDSKIYQMRIFSKEVLQMFNRIEGIDIKAIEEKIKNKEIKSLFGTATIIRFLYDRIKKIPKNKKEKREYCRYALLFPKEFIAVIYLYILNEQYQII